MKTKLLLILLFVILFENLSAQGFGRIPSWVCNFNSWRPKSLEGWDIYKGKFSSEQQFYTDSIGNVVVKDGYLHLIATRNKREDKVCSSARVSTKGFKSFTYGKFEIRAKIPTGRGIFPAIWMLREDHGAIFPLGEIDIMEYIECFNGKEYCTTTHIVEIEKDKKEIRHKHSKLVAADMNVFHIYGLEWTPTCLKFLLDRREVYKLEKKDAEFWPFDVPYILILNVAYGSWGSECGMDDSIFPCEMLVDWIRYYPLKNN